MLGNLLAISVLISTCAAADVCFDLISNSSSRVTALILARGGSKGIKLKNIQRIDGISLLGISLTALQEVDQFDSIWVSTDHEAIADEALKYQVNVHWRDPKTALDTTSSIESVHEFLKSHPKVNSLALIQCTSPFIDRSYLRRALKVFPDHHCAFSVVRSFKLRWLHDARSKKVLPINFDYAKRPRRQDWAGELIEAGMFYFSQRELLDKHLFQDDGCGVIEIRTEDSMEIDTPADLEVARVLFNLRAKKRELRSRRRKRRFS